MTISFTLIKCLGEEELFDTMNESIYDICNETISEGEVPYEKAQQVYDGLIS